MPQSATPRDIITAPGFWEKPEKDQISALVGVSPKFKASSPEAQRATLMAAREALKTHPDLAKVSPSPEPVKHSLKEASPGEVEQASKLETPLLGFARNATEKVLGAVGAGAVAIGNAMTPFNPLTPKQKEAGKSFGRGFGMGVADAGIDMTSVVNLSAMGAMKALKYGGKLAQAVRAAASGTFSAEMFKDLPQQFDDAKEAYDKGDMEGAGKAFSHAVADVVFGIGAAKEMGRSGKMATGKTPTPIRPGSSIDRSSRPPEPVATETRKTSSAAEPGEVERPTERQNPKLVEQIREARGKAGAAQPAEPLKEGATREDIEREIGLLQENMNRLEGTKGIGVDRQMQAMDNEIRRLRNLIPEYSLDPNKRAIPPAGPKKATGAPPDVQLTGDTQRERRASEAKQRSKESDPTANFRSGWEAMGIRLAPEEIGELPKQAKPVNRPIVSSGGKALTPQQFWEKQGEKPPEAVIPDGTQPGAADGQQQYTVNRMPGVPAGSTVIFREMGPQGTSIDIVDANGRTTQANLPFRDSIKNMESKGWITAKSGSGDTFPSQRPRGIAVPPEIVKENRPGENLPATVAKTGPPPAAMNFLSPAQLVASVERTNPKALPEPGVTHQMEPLDEAHAGIGQPPEVLQAMAKKMGKAGTKDYIQKINQAFMAQLKGVDPSKLSPEQQTLVKTAWSQLQQYLDPFLSTLKEDSANGGKGKPVTAPLAVAAGPMPPSIAAEVQNITTSAIKRQGGLPWNKVSIQPVGDDLKTPVGDPVVVPVDGFTPEQVWQALSAAKGAVGIAVSDPETGIRNGVVRRRLVNSAPPGVVK